MYSYGPPHMAEQKQDDQHEHTFSNYVRTRDVVQKTCQRRWMIRKSGERGSEISVLPAHDDDDDIHDSVYFAAAVTQFILRAPWLFLFCCRRDYLFCSSYDFIYFAIAVTRFIMNLKLYNNNNYIITIKKVSRLASFLKICTDSSIIFFIHKYTWDVYLYFDRHSCTRWNWKVGYGGPYMEGKKKPSVLMG